MQSPRGAHLVVLLALLIPLSSACGPSPAVHAVHAIIKTDPPGGTPIDFGPAIRLHEDTADPQRIAITNLGKAPLQIEVPQLEGPGREAFRVHSSPKSLLPGQSQALELRFEPSRFGDYEAELVLRSNARNAPELRWPIRAKATEDCKMTLSPSLLRFRLYETKTATLTVISSVDCVIQSVDTDQRIFEVKSPKTLPIRMQQGQTLGIELTHAKLDLSRAAPVRSLSVAAQDGSRAWMQLIGQTPLRNCLSLDPSVIDFGSMPVGTARTERLRVDNRCAEPLELRSGTLSSGYRTFTLNASFPMTVPAHGQVYVELGVQPKLPEALTGQLVLNTTDGAYPQLSARLAVTGERGKILVSPDHLDFGTVAFRRGSGSDPGLACRSPVRRVKIRILGGAPFTIHELRLEQDPSAPFQVIAAELDGRLLPSAVAPIEVPAAQGGQSRLLELLIQFAPQSESPAQLNAQLILNHNAEAPNPVQVALTGQTRPQLAQTDRFRMPLGEKADVLFVIDDSGSMIPAQAALRRNMQAFIQEAESQHGDYAIAVTTTDGDTSASGSFRHCDGYPAVVRGDWGNAQLRQNALDCIFQVGMGGSGVEAGLSAAVNALRRVRSSDPGFNAGFLRPGARLNIVVISDEDDQSPLPLTVARDYLVGVMGDRPDLVKLHAIAFPPDGPCENASWGNWSEPGYRYLRMTQLMQGRFTSICTQDWSAVLSGLSRDTFTPNRIWRLSQRPDPSTLQVYLDGIALPRDLSLGYQYDPVENHVVLADGIAISPGMELEVDYQGVCEP